MQKKEYDKLMKDIEFMGDTIRKNSVLLRQIRFVDLFRFQAILGGICVILFALSWHFLMRQYLTMTQMPSLIKFIYFVLLALAIPALGFIKWNSIVSEMKNIDQSITLSGALKEFMKIPAISHAYLSSVLTLIILIPYLIIFGHPAYIVPATSVFFGFMFIVMGGTLTSGEFLLCGYWLILSGLASCVLIKVPALINLCCTQGLGFIIFGVSGYLTRRNVKGA